MKVVILLSLATLAYASLYELPVVKTVIVKHIEEDLHHYDALPKKSYIAVSPKSHHLQSLELHHPALIGVGHGYGHGYGHYPVKKYTVHYPSGLYHGPHGLGIYDPKLHDHLEQAYYRG